MVTCDGYTHVAEKYVRQVNFYRASTGRLLRTNYCLARALYAAVLLNSPDGHAFRRHEYVRVSRGRGAKYQR